MQDAIAQARAHLQEPPARSGLAGAFFAVAFWALSAMLLAGAMIFGQLA